MRSILLRISPRNLCRENTHFFSFLFFFGQNTPSSQIRRVLFSIICAALYENERGAAIIELFRALQGSPFMRFLKEIGVSFKVNKRARAICGMIFKQKEKDG